MRWGLVSTFIFGLATTSFADVVISLDPTPEANDFAAAVGYDLNQLEADIQRDIQEIYGLFDPDEYLGAFANAASLSNKGLGVDYASNMTSFSFGGGLNVAASAGNEGFEGVQEGRLVGGLAGNISIMAGINLGVVGFDRVNLYANYFKRSMSFNDYLNIDSTNLGIHAQIKLITPKVNGLAKYAFQWGGLDLTTGLQSSTLKFTGGETIRNEFSVGENGMQRMASLTATGDYELDLNAIVVPIELSTNARLLYFLSIYGGVGADLQAGKAKLTVNVTGDLEAEDPNDPSQTVNLGTGNITASEESGPSVGKFRAFAGAQVNILQLKIYTQADLTQNLAASLSLGARVVW